MWLLILLTWLYIEGFVQNIGASKHALLLGKYYEIVHSFQVQNKNDFKVF